MKKLKHRIIKNFFVTTCLIFSFVLNFLPSSSSLTYTDSLFSIKNTYAAVDQSNFQNNSNWFLKYWKKVVDEASDVVQWFQQKTKSVLSGGQSIPQTQNSLSQYPTISGQKSINDQQMSFPIQQQSSSGSDGSNQQGGGENGTPGSPYKLEPNQFKKDCGQNTYVLYWRKGGEKGRDMAQPVQQGPGAGKDQAQIVYWILPTCEELSKCHCCCNTCTFPQGEICPQGWCFSKNTICDDKKECSNKCSNKCDEKCKKGCEDYKEPTHKTAFNRDCKCTSNGCPSENSNGCKIKIVDPGQSQIEYTDSKDKTWKETPAGAPGAFFENGYGKDDKQSRLKVGPNDTKENGYVKKLKDQKGVCCKCYKDGPPITGGGGSSGDNSSSSNTGDQTPISPYPEPGKNGTTDPYGGATSPYSQDQLTRQGFVKNSDGTYTDPVLGTDYKLGNDGFYHPTDEQ